MECPKCHNVAVGQGYIRRFVPSRGDKRGYYIEKCECGWQRWTPHRIYWCQARVISNIRIIDYGMV